MAQRAAEAHKIDAGFRATVNRNVRFVGFEWGVRHRRSATRSRAQAVVTGVPMGPLKP